MNACSVNTNVLLDVSKFLQSYQSMHKFVVHFSLVFLRILVDHILVLRLS